MPVWSGVWIVITGTVTGNPADGYRTEYASDLREFSHKHAATRHGFTLGRSDDFNLGFVRNGRLESLWWMEDRTHGDAETLARIGREIGLTAGTPPSTA
jgi:hypothetical protein